MRSDDAQISVIEGFEFAFDLAPTDLDAVAAVRVGMVHDDGRWLRIHGYAYAPRIVIASLDLDGVFVPAFDEFRLDSKGLG